MDNKLQNLEDGRANLLVEIRELISAVEHGESLLSEMHIHPEIIPFMRRWSARECKRLGEVGMFLGIDERDARLMLKGQHDAVSNLGKDPDLIQMAVDENRAMLGQAQNNLIKFDKNIANQKRSKR